VLSIPLLRLAGAEAKIYSWRYKVSRIWIRPFAFFHRDAQGASRDFPMLSDTSPEKDRGSNQCQSSRELHGASQQFCHFILTFIHLGTFLFEEEYLAFPLVICW